MNYLKKKLKPLTSGFNNQAATTTSGNQQQRGHHNKDLEDDLYDEYVVEAPPHPSELLALGVEPTEIDINDPDKLRELYRKAKEEGKDKKTNSVLLARARQKEEIEEKKRTREEWKFFDSLTSRVEQVVKESQKNLDHWKESSAVSELTEPDYELRQTADEVFRSVTAAKLEKGANDWIDFDEDSGTSSKKKDQNNNKDNSTTNQEEGGDFDEFGCPKRRASSSVNESQNIVVKELLEDFGIDLRTAKQREALEKRQRQEEEEREKERKKLEAAAAAAAQLANSQPANKLDATTTKIVARPRPRPKNSKEEPERQESSSSSNPAKPLELDPFDTSFVAAKTPELEQVVAAETIPTDTNNTKTTKSEQTTDRKPEQAKFVDPFDTSYVNL
uniref:Uncharacterized protein n=1 Tax=Aceria tosichella TaxID=561515 RepID=A0A6G1S8M2_9ACAR